MPAEKTEQRKLAAIMFTDMVGHSALSQRNEARALELLEEHRRIVRGLLSRHGGREVKTTGDGFLIEFPSALAAVQGAVEIQGALHKRNEFSAPEVQLHIRIGIHIGDVVMRDGDIHGDGVNIAARIEPLAAAGGICISSAVYDQVRNKLSQPMIALGPAELKNIELPMVVHRVVLPWETESSSRREEARTSKSEIEKSRLTTAATKFGWVTILLLFAVGVGGWFVHQSSQTTKPGASSPGATNSLAAATTSTTDQKSIAVLPFVNLSQDKADEYLSDGMTEELLNVLSKIKGLRVPGRSSSFAFKGKSEEDIFRRMGEQLHVHAILEGSVRKAGNQLRITAQLINVADGFHLWSETYDRDMTNIFVIQSDIAERVALALKVQLGVQETRALAKKPTQNTEAYRLYLLGRYHFAKSTQAGWTNSIHYYNQAIQADPSYALAYCGLADTYGWMGIFVMPGKEAWSKEKTFAQQALTLDPNLADAHASLGLALLSAFDWLAGENETKRALELNPKLALAHDQYAWLLAMFGPYDEAIARLKKALDLDPLSLLLNDDLGWLLRCARRYDESIEQLRKTLELDSNFADAHHTLGWSLLWKGKTPAAITEFEKAKTLDDLPGTDAGLGYAYAVSGNRAKAEQILRELEDLAKRRYVSPSLRVIV